MHIVHILMTYLSLVLYIYIACAILELQMQFLRLKITIFKVPGVSIQQKKSFHYSRILWKVPLCYILCRSLFATQFWSNFCPIPVLCAKIPAFYASIFPSSAIVGFLCSLPLRARASCANEGGGGVHTGGKKLVADVRTELFWRAIYCAKPNSGDVYHPGSRSRRGLGRQAFRIIHDYDLVISIEIWQLIYPPTCEMGSSIFAAMSLLKFASNTRASLPSIISTERTNGWFIHFSWQCLPCLSLFVLYQLSRSLFVGSNL